jgi:hypothetical protein
MSHISIPAMLYVYKFGQINDVLWLLPSWIMFGLRCLWWDSSTSKYRISVSPLPWAIIFVPALSGKCNFFNCMNKGLWIFKGLLFCCSTHRSPAEW